MSGLATGGTGLVKSLRETATTERLRSDHIMTLELMQETVDDNAELKAANKRLLARLTHLGDGGSAGEEDATAKSGNDADAAGNKAVLQKVLQQAEELTALRTENKLLKGRASQDEKRIRDLQRSSSSNEAMKRELDAFKAKLAAEERAAAAAEGAAGAAADSALLEAQIAELASKLEEATWQLRGHVPGCALRISELESELSAAGTPEEGLEESIAAARAQVQSLEQQLELLLAEEETKDAASTVLQAKYRDLRKSCDDGERALQDKLHRAAQASQTSQAAATAQLELVQTEVNTLQAANASLRKEAAELQAALAKLPNPNPLLLQAEPEPEPEVDSAFFLTGAPTAAPAPAAAASTEGVSFNEFVRMRTENKSLKLQLLQLSQSQSQPQGQGRGAGGKGPHMQMRTSASAKAGAAGSFFM